MRDVDMRLQWKVEERVNLNIKVPVNEMKELVLVQVFLLQKVN